MQRIKEVVSAERQLMPTYYTTWQYLMFLWIRALDWANIERGFYIYVQRYISVQGHERSGGLDTHYTWLSWLFFDTQSYTEKTILKR